MSRNHIQELDLAAASIFDRAAAKAQRRIDRRERSRQPGSLGRVPSPLPSLFADLRGDAGEKASAPELTAVDIPGVGPVQVSPTLGKILKALLAKLAQLESSKGDGLSPFSSGDDEDDEMGIEEDPDEQIATLQARVAQLEQKLAEMLGAGDEPAQETSDSRRGRRRARADGISPRLHARAAQAKQLAHEQHDAAAAREISAWVDAAVRRIARRAA